MSGSSRAHDPDADDDPVIDQPGLGRLRSAVATVADKALPRRATLVRDGTAGLTITLSQVPAGMANGLLAGVNPIYGLYANAVGPIVGGALTSSQLMVINNGSAVALVAGQALVGISSGDRDGALFTMVMLAGAFAIVLGLLGLGKLTRFVSFSVMTGFVAGIAVVLLLSQLPTVTGISVDESGTVAQTLALLARLGDINPISIGLAVLTLVLALGLPRIGLNQGAALVAIAVPTLLVAVTGVDGVALVRDVGDITGGVPSPFLPSLSDLSVDVLTGAIAVAVIVLVQASGVSRSVPNPDGAPSDSSRDFLAQGAANVAAGVFRGLPVGGSLGGTAMNVTAGGASRWAGILSGVWMAVILVAFPGAIARVVMPALGALLIVAGLTVLSPSDVVQVWRAGWPSIVAAATTFVSTLFLPIQVAVGYGVALSALLYIIKSSNNITLVEVMKRPDGRIEERAAPRTLRDDTVTVLDVYGQLFFAGARTLESRLPSPQDVQHPVVVLRLRGRTDLGATLVEALSGYAKRLQEAGGRLYVTGVSEEAREHLLRTGDFGPSGPAQVYEGTPVIGESTEAAYSDAQAWLLEDQR